MKSGRERFDFEQCSASVSLPLSSPSFRLRFPPSLLPSCGFKQYGISSRRWRRVDDQANFLSTQDETSVSNWVKVCRSIDRSFRLKFDEWRSGEPVGCSSIDSIAIRRNLISTLFVACCELCREVFEFHRFEMGKLFFLRCSTVALERYSRKVGYICELCGGWGNCREISDRGIERPTTERNFPLPE